MKTYAEQIREIAEELERQEGRDFFGLSPLELTKELDLVQHNKSNAQNLLQWFKKLEKEIAIRVSEACVVIGTWRQYYDNIKDIIHIQSNIQDSYTGDNTTYCVRIRRYDFNDYSVILKIDQRLIEYTPPFVCTIDHFRSTALKICKDGYITPLSRLRVLLEYGPPQGLVNLEPGRYVYYQGEYHPVYAFPANKG